MHAEAGLQLADGEDAPADAVHADRPPENGVHVGVHQHPVRIRLKGSDKGKGKWVFSFMMIRLASHSYQQAVVHVSQLLLLLFGKHAATFLNQIQVRLDAKRLQVHLHHAHVHKEEDGVGGVRVATPASVAVSVSVAAVVVVVGRKQIAKGLISSRLCLRCLFFLSLRGNSGHRLGDPPRQQHRRVQLLRPGNGRQNDGQADPALGAQIEANDLEEVNVDAQVLHGVVLRLLRLPVVEAAGKSGVGCGRLDPPLSCLLLLLPGLLLVAVQHVLVVDVLLVQQRVEVLLGGEGVQKVRVELAAEDARCWEMLGKVENELLLISVVYQLTFSGDLVVVQQHLIVDVLQRAFALVLPL